MVLARQPGGLRIAGVVHAQALGTRVHELNKVRQAAWIGPAQGMGSTVFTRHQRQVQQFATAERGTHGKPGGAAFFGVDIGLADGDFLIRG